MYLEEIVKRHPEVAEYIDPAYDVHNLQLGELRAMVTARLEVIRIRNAAIKIQGCWRRKHLKANSWSMI